MRETNNKKFWDHTAGIYTFIQEGFNARFYKKLCDELMVLIKSTDKVLEIGCGSGQLTLPLSPYSGYWVATDFSDKMIRQTSKRLKENSKVICVVEDATGLTFPDNSFDTVVIANVLHIMPNPSQALLEIHRVLKPNGLLIAPTFVYDGNESKLWLKLMSFVGFKTYTKWSPGQLQTFIQEHGFKVLSNNLIQGSSLTECVLTAYKQAR